LEAVSYIHYLCRRIVGKILTFGGIQLHTIICRKASHEQ